MNATPDVIRRFFALEADRDLDALIALFSDDATVLDEGQTRRGTDAIRAWRTDVASKYTYSTKVRGVDHRGAGRYVVDGRITGDFPGGVADLTWEFTLADDQIRRLAIAPPVR